MAIVLVDIVVYLVPVLGLGNQVKAVQQLREGLFRRVRDEEMRVARLQKFQASLPDAKKQLEQFEQEHVPARRRGFSRAARRVREVAEQSGVQLSGVAYKLDSDHSQPLERLAITVNVEGPFASLVQFVHALETSGDFIVVREFNFQPREGEILALRIAADLYLAR